MTRSPLLGVLVGMLLANAAAAQDLSSLPLGPNADLGGVRLLPDDSPWNQDIEKGAIPHALRFTLSKTRRAYVPPASHWASDETDEDLPPMGMRVRLKADYDISSFPPVAQAILQAMKTYGMILANNGSDNFISGTHDPRWNADAVAEIRRVTTKDLEVVEMNGLVAGE